MNGNENSVDYVSIFDNFLIRSLEDNLKTVLLYLWMTMIFCHRSWIIGRKKNSENNVPQMEKPASSPDINPIENVWYLKNKIVFSIQSKSTQKPKDPCEKPIGSHQS